MREKIKKHIKQSDAHIEVDVSGQLGVDGDTVFALSNGEEFAILIRSTIKRAAKKHYLGLKKRPGRFYFNLYVGGLLLLLNKLKENKRQIFLDWELYKREGEVKGELLVRAARRKIDLSFLEISSRRVGKTSPAHILAIDVYRRRKKAHKLVSLKELLEVLQ